MESAPACTPLRLMSATATRAPSFASMRAEASPRPCAAPVMSAIFPSTRPVILRAPIEVRTSFARVRGADNKRQMNFACLWPPGRMTFLDVAQPLRRAEAPHAVGVLRRERNGHIVAMGIAHRNLGGGMSGRRHLFDSGSYSNLS